VGPVIETGAAAPGRNDQLVPGMALDPEPAAVEA
jgi:hypothetical protein